MEVMMLLRMTKPKGLGIGKKYEKKQFCSQIRRRKVRTRRMRQIKCTRS